MALRTTLARRLTPLRGRLNDAAEALRLPDFHGVFASHATAQSSVLRPVAAPEDEGETLRAA